MRARQFNYPMATFLTGSDQALPHLNHPIQSTKNPPVIYLPNVIPTTRYLEPAYQAIEAPTSGYPSPANQITYAPYLFLYPTSTLFT